MKKYSQGEKCLVMSRDEVRAFDEFAINKLGIPGVVLMENAGRSCAELIKKKLADVKKPKARLPRLAGREACGGAKPRVCIFCGTGNNGGDGYVIARHLLNSGFKVVVVLCGDRSKVKGDAKINLDILEAMGQPIEQLTLEKGNIGKRVKSLATDCVLVVDAIFGTGLSGQVSDEYKELIESINGLKCPILAVDIPSGLDCDSGEPLGAAIRATWTVTFVAVKKGFAAAGAKEYTGEIYVASIGVEPNYSV